MKGYTVFNTEQIEGLPAHYYPAPAAPVQKLALIESAEAFFAGTGAIFRHGGNRAYYAPSRDVISFPCPRHSPTRRATRPRRLTN